MGLFSKRDSKQANITLGLRVKLVIFLTSPLPGATQQEVASPTLDSLLSLGRVCKFSYISPSWHYTTGGSHPPSFIPSILRVKLVTFLTSPSPGTKQTGGSHLPSFIPSIPWCRRDSYYLGLRQLKNAT